MYCIELCCGTAQTKKGQFTLLTIQKLTTISLNKRRKRSGRILLVTYNIVIYNKQTNKKETNCFNYTKFRCKLLKSN